MDGAKVAVERLHKRRPSAGQRAVFVEEALRRLQKLEALVGAVRGELAEIDAAHEHAGAGKDERRVGKG